MRLALSRKRAHGQTGIPASRLEATQPIVTFNSDVWKQKRDRGLSLNVELTGVAVPADLTPYEADLRRMHRLA